MRLRLHQTDINRLNVYPVPDGDTGHQHGAHPRAVASELDGVEAGAGLAAVCKAIGARVPDGGAGQFRGHPVPAAAGIGRAHGDGRAAGVAPRRWSCALVTADPTSPARR